MGRVGRLVVVVGVVLWVVVPVVCIGVVRQRADRVRLRTDEATSVEVTANAEEQVAEAGLRLVWAAHSPVVAPAWTGTVTEIRAKAGDRAVDGQAVLVVDGVERVLVASRRPFARPLGYDATGPDVADLNDLLRRRGLPASDGDRFGGATERGVTAFATSIGAGPATVFEPAWVLFLSQAGSNVATVAGTVGAPAPATGEVVLALAPELRSAAVIPPQTIDVGTAEADAGTTGEPAGGGASTGATGAAAEQLRGVEPIEVPAGAVLRVDDHDLALAEDRRSVADRSLGALAAAAGSTVPYVDATFATPPAEGELVVPAAAVISDQQGRTCVRTAGAEGGPVEVAVLGGDGGRAVITTGGGAALRPGTRVEVAVPAGRRSCR